jgi:hypothetical protein
LDDKECEENEERHLTNMVNVWKKVMANLLSQMFDWHSNVLTNISSKKNVGRQKANWA